MRKIIMLLAIAACLWTVTPIVHGQNQGNRLPDSVQNHESVPLVQADSLMADSAMAMVDADLDNADEEALQGGGLHKQLKRKFIEGSASFMSLVALALVLGLAFCIERIVYLTLSEVNTKKFLADVDAHLEQDDVEGAKDLCRNTRGPVASICYQALLHIREKVDDIDRQLTNYGTVQISNMEKGCSWIRLFIAIAPSLGFLGTVIGMVIAFDNIETAGNIGPTIVAKGMKVALITTIFGIIVAIILQFFYSYILSKIDRLTTQMEEGAITLMDAVVKYKARNNG